MVVGIRCLGRGVVVAAVAAVGIVVVGLVGLVEVGEVVASGVDEGLDVVDLVIVVERDLDHSDPDLP